MGNAANFTYVDSQLNWESLVDYFVLNSYVVNQDWLNWNTSWWRGMDPLGDKKKWRYALWDMDATFGHYINYTGIPDPSANADPCNAENLPNPGGQGHTDILEKLIAENKCNECHIRRVGGDGNSIYKPTGRINNAGALRGMVEYCNTELNLGFFPEDTNAVAAVLNLKHYKFR
jgi:hypothetical protein